MDTPDSSSSSEPDNVSTPLNHFVEDDIIVYGTVNGIDTSIIIDSGAKISVVSDDFVELDMEPVSFVPISGISEVPKSVPVFSMPISLPTMQGGCLLAMDTRLPPQTVLLGLDFGLENIVNLINHVNSDPYPVLTVTRAMQADSEGAKPTSFDELPEVQDEIDTSPKSPNDSGLVPLSFPNLSFDGVSKQEFVALQKSDASLAPLWELARKGEKQFFVV